MQNILQLFYDSSMFLIPGFIIDYLVEQGIPNKETSDGRSKMIWLFYSSLVYVLIGWAYPMIQNSMTDDKAWGYILSFLLLILVSVGIGCIFACLMKNEIIYKALNKLKIPSKSPYPSAWDYKFYHCGPQYVEVKLKSGQTIYGCFEEKSFASGEIDNQDLYLGEICDENFDPLPETDGVWIAADEISRIVFRKV